MYVPVEQQVRTMQYSARCNGRVLRFRSDNDRLRCSQCPVKCVPLCQIA